jgi:choice-of-anchor B domain-containing protein
MKKIVFFFILQVLLSRTLEVQFQSENDWLYGRSWSNGTTFYNSIAQGGGLTGQSTLSENEMVNVVIHFSENHDSLSVAPVYSIVDNSFLGLGTFPGIAVDMNNPNNPRRINIAFFEEENDNLFWDPDDIQFGGYEYLLIMLSDYDASGSIYESNPAYNADVQYFCWLRRRPGQDWFSSIPAQLEFNNIWEFSSFYLTSENQEINLFWEHENPEIEQYEIATYQIYKGESQNTIELIEEVNSDVHTFNDINVDNGISYSYSIIGLDENGEIIIESEIISGIPNVNIFNMEFIANWDEGNENSFIPYGVSTYNDIWGYEDGNGNEYALVGGFDGTYIVDVSTTPDTPQLVSFIPGSHSTHRDIKTFGHYMYVGTEANLPDPVLLNETGEVYKLPQGVQVVNLTNPEEAELINEWDGVVQSHNIMEADGYLYVIGSTQIYSDDGEQESWGRDDLIILDLESNPAEPVKIGGWSGEYLHDVCIYDDILYGNGIYSASMIAFDISDKSNPQIITQWYGIPSSHACWVSEDGNTLFTGSETSGGHIMSWDVSDIYNIEYLDEWMPPGGEQFSAHNIFVKGQFLYISYYVYGLQVLDISDPSNLTHAGAFDTYLENSSYIYSGAWGAYPYLSSGKILISDRQTGLYVTHFLEDNLSNSQNLPFQNKFDLIKNYPNPANPKTNLVFNIKIPGKIVMKITDLNGRLIFSENLGELSMGQYEKTFDLESFSSGVYWVKMSQTLRNGSIQIESLPITILK